MTQIADYNRLRSQYAQRYRDVAQWSEVNVVPIWEEVRRSIVKAFTPWPPFDFITVGCINWTMGANKERIGLVLPFLERYLVGDDQRWWHGDACGGSQPVSHLHSDWDTLHYAYQALCLWQADPGFYPGKHRIVEWGGGYGGMAKVLMRWCEGSTYVDIDLPELCHLAWLYLSIVLGEDKVVMLTGEHDAIQEGMVNIVPVGLAPRLDIHGDTLIAMASLAECPAPVIDSPLVRGLCDTEHIFVTGVPSARIVQRLCEEHNCQSTPMIPWPPVVMVTRRACHESPGHNL